MAHRSARRHTVPPEIRLDFEPGRPHCGDCRVAVSLLPSRIYPQAWSQIEVAVGGRILIILFCANCGQRRLAEGDDSYDLSTALGVAA